MTLSGLPLALRWRLSLLMFGQFIVLGSWSVTLPTWLLSAPRDGGLGFAPTDAFWIFSTIALGGLLAPVLASLLADRLFSIERLLGVLTLLGAGLLVLAALTGEFYAPRIRAAAEAGDASPANAAFWPLFAILLIYNVGGMLGLTLTSTLCLRNLPDPDRQFPQVRLWGTAGWIVAGLVVGFLIRAKSPDPLWLAAGLSVPLGIFSFWLPHTPPAGLKRTLADVVGLPAARLYLSGPLLIFAICVVLVTVYNSFYAFGFNKFLEDLQFKHPAALQTVGQVVEIISMLLIPWGLRHIGLKGLMLIGLTSWLLRYLVFITESRPLIVAVGIPLHGLSHSLFFIAATPFVDRHAPRHLRASMQGVLMFLSMTAGQLPGNWLAAWVVGRYTGPDGIDWPSVWLVPASMAAVVLVFFAVGFRAPPEPSSTATEPLPITPAVEAGEPV